MIRLVIIIGGQTIIEIVRRIEVALPKKAVFGVVDDVEFCLFETGLDRASALALAKRIQAYISMEKIPTDIGNWDVSVSLKALYTKDLSACAES
ncbi:hypothetical protein AB4298_17510 [Shewanella sp. 10N.261.52.F9]|uniref:hypothetical protein n=1 Tax=Shewanella sp. 10N.261.52.F9 TaxID=3229684 RepID=UPI00354E8C00